MNSTSNGHTNAHVNGTGGSGEAEQTGDAGQSGGADDERAAAYLARTLRQDIDAAGETRAAAALLVWLAAETEEWARSLNLPCDSRCELLALAQEARRRVREARRTSGGDEPRLRA